MKLVNPIGREVSSGFEANSLVQPMACQCSVWTNFTIARGDDSCLHCGCHCSGSNVVEGNDSSAFWAIRRSPPAPQGNI